MRIMLHTQCNSFLLIIYKIARLTEKFTEHKLFSFCPQIVFLTFLALMNV